MNTRIVIIALVGIFSVSATSAYSFTLPGMITTYCDDASSDINSCVSEMYVQNWIQSNCFFSDIHL